MTTWLGCSEVVTGLVLEGRISPMSVRDEILIEPYNQVIKAKKKDPKITIEELVEMYGIEIISTAHEAVKNMNGIGELDWVGMLENAHQCYGAGQRLEKASKKLLRGEQVNWGEIADITRKAQEGTGNDFVPLSDVEDTGLPFIQSGWEVIDTHLGGIPEVGIILIGGDPGIGKTTAMGQFAVCFAKHYPDKNVAIFSLEMILGELKQRIIELHTFDDSVGKRLLLNETPLSANDIINKASTIENLGLICVDFADLVVKENTEAAYSEMYRTFMFGAKLLHVPIIVLVQLVKNKTGFPKPSQLRYTKMAESFAWMILMLYDPAKDWDTEEDSRVLPAMKDKSYILVWKIRGGAREHREEFPGAIRIPFRGDKGWGMQAKNTRWISLRKEL